MTDEVEKFQQDGLSWVEATRDFAFTLVLARRLLFGSIYFQRKKAFHVCCPFKNPDHITTIDSRDEVETQGECVMATRVCVVCVCVCVCVCV